MKNITWAVISVIIYQYKKQKIILNLTIIQLYTKTS